MPGKLTNKSFVKPTTLNGAISIMALSVLVLEGCIIQIFPCTALTLNGLQKISHIPSHAIMRVHLLVLGKSGDET